jgi:hypothetical protein
VNGSRVSPSRVASSAHEVGHVRSGLTPNSLILYSASYVPMTSFGSARRASSWWWRCCPLRSRFRLASFRTPPSGINGDSLERRGMSRPSDRCCFHMCFSFRISLCKCRSAMLIGQRSGAWSLRKALPRLAQRSFDFMQRALVLTGRLSGLHPEGLAHKSRPQAAGADGLAAGPGARCGGRRHPKTGPCMHLLVVLLYQNRLYSHYPLAINRTGPAGTWLRRKAFIAFAEQFYIAWHVYNYKLGLVTPTRMPPSSGMMLPEMNDPALLHKKITRPAAS